MNRRSIVFDLDGTLIDTLPDLAAALNRLMASKGLAPLAETEIACFIGDGVGVLATRVLALRGREASKQDIAAFAADYAARPAERSLLFPGVQQALDALLRDGWLISICTNKPEAPARALLAAVGIADYFTAIGAGDTYPVRKPDPAHLIATIVAGGGYPAAAVVVGDHANDIAAARGAGLPAIFAGWGYGAREMAQGTRAVAETFAEVPALARSLLPG